MAARVHRKTRVHWEKGPPPSRIARPRNDAALRGKLGFTKKLETGGRALKMGPARRFLAEFHPFGAELSVYQKDLQFHQAKIAEWGPQERGFHGPGGD